ncbi:hypothetical protein [Halovenus salina]|uniref:Uncharacterized protein n=1 Tax=Halovenus salina TaxID=1510225 RepID=A0ABD5W308_9EURY|nr:hypothetical protein [Halovenus salina]
MTDTNDTTESDTAQKPTRDDGQPMKMREMDHAPPVEGTRRVFERANEGKTARPDGGTETTEDDEFNQKMKEMDHTPPVDGPNRTFERGADVDK